MRTHTTKILLALVVFAVALGGALLLMNARGSTEKTPQPAKQASAMTSSIWKVGDTWTVKVRQDAGAITPGGDTSIALVPFRFTVAQAAGTESDSWLITVMQDGAEGPFAAGWKLQYRDVGGAMVLHKVAVGDEPALEAELASIVLGPQFPYEVQYSAPPTNLTLDADKLLERSTLPPGSLPNGSTTPPGAMPPAEAPKLEAGGARPSTPSSAP